MQIRNIRAVGRMSRIISRTSEEISDSTMQAYYDRQAVRDRLADNFDPNVGSNLDWRRMPRQQP